MTPHRDFAHRTDYEDDIRRPDPTVRLTWIIVSILAGLFFATIFLGIIMLAVV